MINAKYIIGKKIGEGRSKVFLCEDQDFPGKELAIKILPPDVPSEEAEIFRNEFSVIRRLNHPNIIKANETGTVVKNDDYPDISAGSKFITLEFFPGKDLLSFNIENEETLRSIAIQIASVLYYLHQSNFIYYDLKPENILVISENEKPVIKLIDLGFARYAYDSKNFNARGTAEYIAPELFEQETHDHRVDLYSFGMLLYRLIYKKFPFETINEIDIYKAHIEGNFDFPQTEFSDELISIVKKLLARKPKARYYTSLEVLIDLSAPVHELKKDWIPANSFTNMKDSLSVINSYINKHSDGEVLVIRGVEGAGKTSIMEEIFRKYEKTILIRSSRQGGNSPFWKFLLREIVFNDFVFPNLTSDLSLEVFSLLNGNPADLIDSLRTVILKIVKEKEFILLLDDYNRYDKFSLEIMEQLIPVFRVNNTRLIITEDSSHPYICDTISNLTVINLTPFTENHVIEFTDKAFASFFPKEDAKKSIMMYSDLLPGSIDSFLKDIIFLNIIRFSGAGPAIIQSEENIELLKSSQDEIYKLRLKELNEKEIYAAMILSVFDTVVEDKVLSGLIDSPKEETEEIINSLRDKNILSPFSVSINPEFTSEGLKKHLYSNIDDKNSLHLKAAEVIEKNYQSFNRPELARQFESAGLFYRSYEIYKRELEESKKLSAFSYIKKILIHLLEFPLVQKDISELKFELAQILFKMGDKKASLEILKELLNEKLDDEKLLELKILEGNCLISTGEHSEGIKILEEILPLVSSNEKKQEILFDIASGEFDLNNYSETLEICNEIINNKYSGSETRGKAYNLLGLIEIYEKGNIDGAIPHFESALLIYEQAGLMLNVARMEINLGNIFNMKGDHEQAELYWNKAMEINRSVGNMEQEAKLLLNYGIYNFDKLDFDKAVSQYSQANNILSGLGDKNGEGLALTNLGEIFMVICEYQKSYDCLLKARKIFKELMNYEEEAIVIFMIGKFFYITGHNESLFNIVKALQDFLNKKLINEKHKINLEMLEQLLMIMEEEHSESAGEIKRLRDLFWEAGDRNNFIFLSFVLCDLLLKDDKFDEALEVLNNENLLAAALENPLVEAERNYYEGKVNELNPSGNLSASIENYEKAFSVIEELSITEVTRKILSALSEFYISRGNTGKAEEYLIYLKSIIEFISEKIRDTNIRTAYLSKPEIVSAIENQSTN